MIRKLTRRGKRVLMIDFYYTATDGRTARFRKDADVPTVAAATAEERRLLANVARYGSPYEPSAEPQPEGPTITFGDVVRDFHAAKLAALKPSTRHTYREIIETRLLPRWRDTPIRDLGFDASARLDADMAREGLSPSRRRNAQVVLRSVLRYATNARTLADMPKLPALPKVGAKVLTTLSMEDAARILGAASPAARVALALGAYAGLRSGEIRELRWRDVDLDRGVVIVRRARSKGEIAPPKSGNERQIPIAAPLDAILRATDGPRAGNTLVAPNGQHEPWGETGLLQALRRACERAAIGGRWRVHDLRHAFVTGLFRGGAGAAAVQALAGHASLAVTQRYAHVDAATLRGAVDVLR